MVSYPELSLEEPEAELLGYCIGCGEEIYETDDYLDRGSSVMHNNDECAKKRIDDILRQKELTAQDLLDYVEWWCGHV